MLVALSADLQFGLITIEMLNDMMNLVRWTFNGDPHYK